MGCVSLAFQIISAHNGRVQCQSSPGSYIIHQMDLEREDKDGFGGAAVVDLHLVDDGNEVCDDDDASSTMILDTMECNGDVMMMVTIRCNNTM